MLQKPVYDRNPLSCSLSGPNYWRSLSTSLIYLQQRPSPRWKCRGMLSLIFNHINYTKEIRRVGKLSFTLPYLTDKAPLNLIPKHLGQRSPEMNEQTEFISLGGLYQNNGRVI